MYLERLRTHPLPRGGSDCVQVRRLRFGMEELLRWVWRHCKGHAGCALRFTERQQLLL